jgi:hypothetical protein
MKQREIDLVNKVVSAQQDASLARESLEEKFQAYRDMIEGKLKTENSSKYRSQIYIKETFKVMDTVMPIFLDMLFTQGNAFRVKGIDGPLDQRQAAALEYLISIYIEKMQAYNSIHDFIWDMLQYGTAFGKLTWTKETVDYTEDILETYLGKQKILGIELPVKKTRKRTIDKTKTTKDAPVFEHVSYKDIFFSTRTKNLQTSWVIHRYYKTLEELESSDVKYKDLTGEALFKNMKELSRLHSGISPLDQQEIITSLEKQDLGLNETGKSMDTQGITEDLEVNDDGEIEILEYWTSDNKSVIIVAGRQVVIREMDNPFKHKQKPFIWSNYIRRPHEIWGMGIPELAQDGQDYLNTVTNQGIDSNTLTNNLMFIAFRDRGIDASQLKANPGGIIFADSDSPGEPINNVLQQIKFSKIDTLPEMSVAKGEIQEVTGAGKIMQGSYESGAVRNTSQQRMLMAAGQKKFIGKILTFESMFLKPFVRQMYGLIGQFMETEQVVKIIGKRGEEWIKISPQDICTDLDFMPVGSKQLVEMEQLIHQLNNAVAVIAADPEARNIIDMKNLYRKLLENMLPGMDAQELILSEEETQQRQQQAQQQQLTQMAGQEGVKAQIKNSMNPSQPNMAGGVQ